MAMRMGSASAWGRPRHPGSCPSHGSIHGIPRSLPATTFDGSSASWLWKLESLLSALHWDDSVLRAELREDRVPFAKAMHRLVQTTQNPAILDLLGGFLWQRHMPDWIRSTLESREDLGLALVISQKAARQVSANLRNHLSRLSPLPSLRTIAIDRDDLPVLAKVGAYRMQAMNNASVRATCRLRSPAWNSERDGAIKLPQNSFR